MHVHAALDTRKRVLLVSANGLYPQTIGGIEILGRQVADVLRPMNEIGLLTRYGLVYPEGPCRECRLPLKLFEKHQMPLLSYGKRGFGGIRARVARLKTRLEYRDNTRGWGPIKGRGMRALSRFNPGLIYLNDFTDMYPIVLHDVLNWEVPVIVQFGGVHLDRIANVVNEIWRTQESKACRGRRMPQKIANRLTMVFNCEFLRAHYVPLFGYRFPTATIYQGIDIERFHPRRAPLRGNHWVFLGRVVHEKGFVEFCRAMATLPRTDISTIQIIGDGPALDEGLKILRESGKLDLVTRIGSVTRDEVPDRLREASILVHPSRDEGLPGSVLEAMATGLAVVASNVGGTSEAVQDGQTGLLVPVDDFTGLLLACRKVAEDEHLRHRLGEAARDLVLSRHTLSHFADAMERLIEGAVTRHRVGMEESSLARHS